MRQNETGQESDAGSQNGDEASTETEAQRLTKDEVRARMFRVAEEHVSDRGLTVGLDHISLEELLEGAEVSRTAVHRIWGPKENFFADVIVHLIDPDESRGAAFDEGTLALARVVVDENRHLLSSPEGRARVLREAVRKSARRNYDSIRMSVNWKSHMALSSASPNVADADRERILEALQRVERRFISKMADFYELMLAYVQRVPRDGISLEQIATAGAAVVEGLAVKSKLIPEYVDRTVVMPALDDEEVEWHLAALAFLGVIEALTEPLSGDPSELSISAFNRRR